MDGKKKIEDIVDKLKHSLAELHYIDDGFGPADNAGAVLSKVGVDKVKKFVEIKSSAKFEKKFAASPSSTKEDFKRMAETYKKYEQDGVLIIY